MNLVLSILNAGSPPSSAYQPTNVHWHGYMFKMYWLCARDKTWYSGCAHPTIRGNLYVVDYNCISTVLVVWQCTKICLNVIQLVTMANIEQSLYTCFNMHSRVRKALIWNCALSTIRQFRRVDRFDKDSPLDFGPSLFPAGSWWFDCQMLWEV